MTSASKNSKFLLVLGGLGAGFLNGLLGAGGGILLVWVLGRILADSTRKSSELHREVFANALATMLPISAVSAVTYALRGNLSISGASSYVFPAVFGGLFGAWLLDHLHAGTLRLIFSILMILSGILIILR